jgi:hypothetical protein
VEDKWNCGKDCPSQGPCEEEVRSEKTAHISQVTGMLSQGEVTILFLQQTFLSFKNE